LIRAVELPDLGRAIGRVECVAVRKLNLLEGASPRNVLPPDQVAFVESAMVFSEKAVRELMCGRDTRVLKPELRIIFFMFS
jgi:hypothetical protein